MWGVGGTLSITGWVRHDGGTDLKMRGEAGGIQSNFGTTEDT